MFNDVHCSFMFGARNTVRTSVLCVLYSISILEFRDHISEYNFVNKNIIFKNFSMPIIHKFVLPFNVSVLDQRRYFLKVLEVILQRWFQRILIGWRLRCVTACSARFATKLLKCVSFGAPPLTYFCRYKTGGRGGGPEEVVRRGGLSTLWPPLRTTSFDHLSRPPLRTTSKNQGSGG